MVFTCSALAFRPSNVSVIQYLFSIKLSFQRGVLHFCILRETEDTALQSQEKKPQNFHKIPGNEFDTFATTGGIFYRKMS